MGTFIGYGSVRPLLIPLHGDNALAGRVTKGFSISAVKDGITPRKSVEIFGLAKILLTDE